MKKKVLIWGGSVTLIVVLLIVVFLAGQILARSGTTLAQEDLNKSMPSFPNAPDAISFKCTVDNVAAFENRIHLRCNNPYNTTIYYFAYPTDSAHTATANQILAIANTAFALGKPVWVYFNSSSADNPPGCNTGDCRGLVGVSMVLQ